MRESTNGVTLLFWGLLFTSVPGCQDALPPPPAGGGPTKPGVTDGTPPVSSASVLQHHGGPSRDGHYLEPSFTRDAVRGLHRDDSFQAAITGPTFAQPLFWDGAADGGQSGVTQDLLLVATEADQVYAFTATDGSLVWQTGLGTPVPLSQLPCGNIDPLGVTGTPVIDAKTATLYVDAMTTPDDGTTKKHLIFALSLLDGSILPDWPVDVSARVQGFDSEIQNQRGALLLLGDTLYVPYGGHAGDCGEYHGWVVGVPLASPQTPRAFATQVTRAGIWAPGGLASDGKSIFLATGNGDSEETTPWGGGDAVLRLPPDLTFSKRSADYFTPADWMKLDDSDLDVGSSGPLLLHVEGAQPADLVVAMGKNSKVYLLPQGDLGGVSDGLFSAQVTNDQIITAAAAYTTSSDSYVVFKGTPLSCPMGQLGNLTALRISATAPPRFSVAWCGNEGGLGSPIATTTDGRSESVVFGIGSEFFNRLYAFDGESGDMIFPGGGDDEALGNVRRYQAPIVAKGRIFVAGDDQVYAFTP